MTWASVVGTEAKQHTPEEAAIADRVCVACATWDGNPSSLSEMRFGVDWQVTMAVITPDEQCWGDVMRVCDAIVRTEGHFMGATGYIYSAQQIIDHNGRIKDGALGFPDDQGMYPRVERQADGDPWDDVYERDSGWGSGDSQDG